MNILRAIKVAELRKKLTAIPGKLLITILIFVAYFFLKDKEPFETILRRYLYFSEAELIVYVAAGIFIYGVISYIVFFLQLMKHWFLGVVAAAGTVGAIYYLLVSIPGFSETSIEFWGAAFSPFMIVVLVLVLIGPFFDLLNIFRYYDLKKKVIMAEEEMKASLHNSTYDDGFEEGYRRGMRAAKIESDDDLSKEEYGGESIDETYYDKIDDSDTFDNETYSDYGNQIEDEDYCNSGFDDADDSFADEDENLTYANSENIAGYFADCKTEKEIKRRYHDLCKVYHPDSGNASSDIFCRINAEYVSLIGKNK